MKDRAAVRDAMIKENGIEHGCASFTRLKAMRVAIVVAVLRKYRKSNKMTKQEKYQLYKAQGICPQCKQKWSGHQVMCDNCRSRAEELRKKRRKQLQQSGLCNRCGKHPVIAGTKYCIECAGKAKKYKDSDETKKKRLVKYHEVYKHQLQAKRIEFKENGLCADCGKLPPRFGVVCGGCYAKRRKWYEDYKMKGFNKSLCSGDCERCTLPWCIDINDEVLIKPTAEEKQLSRQLDKKAKEDENRQKAIDKKDLKNAVARYNYNMATIADLESRREQGEILTQQEERKLKNAEKKMIEAKAYIEIHFEGI